MEDSPELTLKKLCCTCLSSDRKLFQLCRINDGVNNLYSLLSHDSEAYREGFYKEAASLFVCWECEATLRRLARFRRQACTAQKRLTCIAEGRNDTKTLKTCFSRLLRFHKIAYDVTIVSDTEIDNFIDCGPEVDIKTENDADDIPLSELHNEYPSDNDNQTESNNYKHIKIKNRIKRKLKAKSKVKSEKKTETDTSIDNTKDYFVSIQMNEEEILEGREKRKMAGDFVDAEFKCESCVETYKSQVGLARHVDAFHVEKNDHTQCSICLSYVPREDLPNHKSDHYTLMACVICEHRAFSAKDIWKHLKTAHGIKNAAVRRKKSVSKPKEVQPTTMPPRSVATLDQSTPYGYPCAECNKYFDNNNQRWKHVQRHHREGYECAACGKRFAFKNNLSRHELMHQGPPPREKCPVCHKLVRVDLQKVHARIHSQRDQHTCVECAKSFVSRASYEHHLKYTQAHASRDILKYKCSVCDKGYRSRGELRDHVNYQHIGQTRHKCPVCGKALATRRCITRHVRRAHQGVKEGPRDKICQQCGKAFRDKKGLREHEFIHTGERPLSCEVCGCTFRQSASLYTHRKRLHKMYPSKKTVELVQETETSGAHRDG